MKIENDVNGTTKNNKEFYDKFWGNRHNHAIYGPGSRWTRSLIFDILEKNCGSNIGSILDIGCGEGSKCYFFAKAFPNTKVTGIDLSNKTIEDANHFFVLPNLSYKQADATKLLYEDISFDMVTAFELLEHIDDWESALNSFCKLANKYLLLSFPTGKMRDYEKEIGHVRNFKKGEVEEFLANKCGFTPLTVYYAGFPIYSPIYRNICNKTNAPNDVLLGSELSTLQRVYSELFFFMLRYFSTKKSFGDQFIGLFSRSSIARNIA